MRVTGEVGQPLAPLGRPMATVGAEKLQAMVALGIASSRIKDFYDLWFQVQTHVLVLARG
jgi:hypothetical protein